MHDSMLMNQNNTSILIKDMCIVIKFSFCGEIDSVFLIITLLYSLFKLVDIFVLLVAIVADLFPGGRICLL